MPKGERPTDACPDSFTLAPAVPLRDLGNIAPGASFSYTFDEAVTIPYVCIYHPNMRATLTVE
jgi:plastocyanin